MQQDNCWDVFFIAHPQSGAPQWKKWLLATHLTPIRFITFHHYKPNPWPTSPTSSTCSNRNLFFCTVVRCVWLLQIMKPLHWKRHSFPQPLTTTIAWFNGLVEGNIYKKQLILRWNMGFSRNISLKPIHWMIKLVNGGQICIWVKGQNGSQKGELETLTWMVNCAMKLESFPKGQWLHWNLGHKDGSQSYKVVPHS